MSTRFLKGIGQQTDWTLRAGFSKNTYCFQAHSNQQIIQSGSRSLRLRERGFIRLVFQSGAKPIELAGVKRSFNQSPDSGARRLVSSARSAPVCKPVLYCSFRVFKFASTTPVRIRCIPVSSTRKTYSKRLHPRRVFFLEQPPLILGKAEIMMCVMAGDAALRDPFQLFVLRCRMYHEWRVQLLKDISVRFQKQLKELLNVMRYQIEVYGLFLGNLHGVADRAQPKDFVCG